MTPQETLNERERKYGDFGVLASAVQAFKNVYRAAPQWQRMTTTQREAMDMLALKKCRILYGDPYHKDNWDDLCGYAMLASEEFTKTPQAMAPAIEPSHPSELVNGK